MDLLGRQTINTSILPDIKKYNAFKGMFGNESILLVTDSRR